MTTPKELKLCIFGGRDFTDYDRMLGHVQRIQDALHADGRTLAIISGLANGADRTAYNLAYDMGLVRSEFPADWDKHGKRAGFLRNTQMAEFCDEAMAYWDGVSRGTRHNISEMKRLGKPCAVHKY